MRLHPPFAGGCVLPIQTCEARVKSCAAFFLKIVLITLAVVSLCPFSWRAQGSDLLSSASIVEAMRRACDYQLRLQADEKVTSGLPEKNDWIRGAFYTGVMATYDATKDPKYLEAARKW